MLILGIETSCDETAVSLLNVSLGKVKVLSNVISSQIKLHAPFGGVVPSLAAREHVKNLPKVIRLALGKFSLKKIDLLAVTRGPGLISSLLVGAAFAKTLAWKSKKPIAGVNHLEGHIASNWLAPVGEISNFQFPISKKIKRKTPNAKHSTVFPALCLIVSGGHTELALMPGIGKYRIVGQTLDDAAGEAFDKIARILGLGYPGGPAISREADNVESKKIKNKNKLKTEGRKLIAGLPRPMINSRGFDFSFAGLKTAVLYLVRDLTKTCPLSKIRTAVAAEAQQAIADVLVSKTIRAAQKYKAKSIMLSGGVSANKLLRRTFEEKCEELGIGFLRPEPEYTTDNAAMIAMAGYFNYLGLKNKKAADWRSVQVNANLAI